MPARKTTPTRHIHRTAPPPDAPKRTSISELALKLADRKAAGASSVTIKTSAQGVVMPEVTIVANEDPAVIDAMAAQAISTFTAIVTAVQTPDE